MDQPTPDGGATRTMPREVAGAAATGGVLFLIYALGACRTIYVGDSGELVTAVHLLGIPHPSGYPLYVLLGKIWTLLLPIGSVAFRMSLFSAACSAAACSLLYLLCRRMSLGAAASLFAALMLAFGPSFWSQANIQRTYSLNALMTVLALLAAWRWHTLRSDRALCLAFFVCGLGAANHTFMVVFAICLGVAAVSIEPSLLKRFRPVVLSALCFVAGMAPYLYLPLRSRAQPRLDWGNPETLEGFLDVVLRRGYWKWAWIEGPGDAIVIARDYLEGIGSELAWAGAALSILGVATMPWRRFALLPLLVMIGNFAAVALHGSGYDIFSEHRYYIPSYVMAAFLAGHGLHFLSRLLPRRLGLTALAIPAALLATGWRAADRSRFTLAEEYSRHVLGSLPSGAHLVATDDNVLFVLMYLHMVEGLRPDVNLIMQGVEGADRPPLRFGPDNDLYFTHHPNWRIPGIKIVPVGLVFRASWSGTPAPSPPPLPDRLEGEQGYPIPKDYMTSSLIGHYHFMLGVNLEARDWPRAWEQFRLAAEAAPDNEVIHYNLGLIYARNSLLDSAEAAFRRSHEINSRYIADPDGPRASDELAEVSRELAQLRSSEEVLQRDPRLASLDPSSSEYHLLMADLLEQNGQSRWARGHRLKALTAPR